MRRKNGASTNLFFCPTPRGDGRFQKHFFCITKQPLSVTVVLQNYDIRVCHTPKPPPRENIDLKFLGGGAEMTSYPRDFAQGNFLLASCSEHPKTPIQDKFLSKNLHPKGREGVRSLGFGGPVFLGGWIFLLRNFSQRGVLGCSEHDGSKRISKIKSLGQNPGGIMSFRPDPPGISN